MPRNSVSPPRRRSRYDDDHPRYSSSRRGDHDRPSYSHNEIKGREYDRRDRDRYDDSRSSSHRRAPRDDGRHYDERERDRERRRDRERYDRNAEADSSRRRRSASPQRDGSRTGSAAPDEDKAKPNFKPSGLLAAETNTVKAADGTATVLKYNEPPEARKPLLGWRLYVFKGSEQLGEPSWSLRSATLDPLKHLSLGSRNAAYTSTERVPCWT